MLTGPDVSQVVLGRIVVTESGCWEWTGARMKSGHGHLYVAGVHWMAHRLAFALLVGDLAAGEIVHHRCENPPCVNPEHLKAVTRKGHAAEHGVSGAAALNAAAATCAKGHPFDHHDGRQRVCRTCARERNREYEQRRGPRDRRGRRRSC